MPRSSRSRPAAPAPRAAPAQTRSSSTAAAAPSSYAHAPPPPPAAAAAASQARPKEPGLLSQMAATAGSVAIGSTIGHGISSMLFGNSHAAPAADASAPPPAQQQQSSGISCEAQAKEFTKCLEKADLPSCTWYLEQLKACQAAAAPY